MAQQLQPPSKPKLDQFLNIYGDELDTCNPNAYDLLINIGKTDNKTLFEDFVWEYADELDACHPEAFDKLSEIASEYGIDLY